MNNTFLYVGDRIVDLFPDTIIAVSVKKIEIGTIQLRRTYVSNSFEVPPTENNMEIFGYANNENSTSTKPYQFIDCRPVVDGVQIIPQARLFITKSQSGSITVTIFENIIDFYQNIKGKVLSDIVPIAPSAWNAAGIDAARTNTSGIVSAIMSWGKSGSIYQVNYFLPCFYYHTIITSILEYTGLTISGDILTDSRFTDLVIPFPGKEFLYPDSLIKSLPAKGYLNSSQSIVALLPSPRVTLDIDAISYGTNLSTSTNRYLFPSDGVYKTARVVGRVHVTTFTLYDASTMTVALYLNNTTVLQSGLIISADSSVDFDYTGSFAPGDFVDIQMYSNGTVTGLDATIINGIDETYLTVIPSRVIDRTMVSWNYLWPEIKCEDLLKDFFTRFAIIPKQNEDVIILKSLEDICSDRNGAMDWSDKLVKTIPEIDFGLQYAQNNYLNYEDSEDTNDPNLGRGNMEISNQTVDIEKDLFTTIFGNSRLIETNVGYRVGHIQVYDSTSTNIDTFANQPGVRLMTLKSRTTEEAITFNATPRTDYFLAYFVDPIQTKDTGFQYFLGQFYLSLESSLQKAKNVTKFFNLNALDVSSYDPHKMVYDGVGYYLANIEKFVRGKITKVKMFKVS